MTERRIGAANRKGTTMKFTRSMAFAQLLGAAAFGAAALTSAPADAQGTQKVLRAAVHADLKVLDPIWTTAYISRNHGYLVYDTLLAQDSKGEVKPQMAESWTVSPDGKTYTFKLRAGLKWHDGQPVTAKDCVASIDRWSKKDPVGRAMMAAGATMAVVDDRTFTLTLRDAFGLVLDALGKPSSNVPFIMPERLAKTDPNTQVSETIGSGPFKFVKEEWAPGNKVVYVKNPDYVPRSEPADALAGGKVAKVDRVEWLYIPDQQSALQSFLRGEYDYFENPQLDFIPIMRKNKDVILVNDPVGYQGWLRPNHLHPPFDNPKARQALSWMVKQEDYMAAIGAPEGFYHKGCPAYFMCGSAMESAVAGEPAINPNKEKAKALLREAGYKGEPVIVMHPTDIPSLTASSMVTIQNLRDIGVNVDVQAMDWSTLVGRRSKKDAPAAGGWHIFTTQAIGYDVASPITNLFVGATCGDGAPGWPCDEQMEKMRTAWNQEPDLAKRKQIAADIQKRAYEIVPYVSWGQFAQPRAVRSNISGVVESGVPVFWNIEKAN
jgi:peptide/nickel transport system substrate-binding protein